MQSLRPCGCPQQGSAADEIERYQRLEIATTVFPYGQASLQYGITYDYRQVEYMMVYQLPMSFVRNVEIEIEVAENIGNRGIQGAVVSVGECGCVPETGRRTKDKYDYNKGTCAMICSVILGSCIWVSTHWAEVHGAQSEVLKCFCSRLTHPPGWLYP